MRVTYNKLVRDRIPEIIQASGGVPITRVLDHRDYRAALLAKLVEEAGEAADASAGELPSELADVYEVLLALVNVCGLEWADLTQLAETKRQKRGSFSSRLFMDHVQHADEED